MSNQNKFGQLQNEGFKPLTEEDERHITGGSAMKPGRCKDDEYMDPNTGLCVKKNSSPTPTTS